MQLNIRNNHGYVALQIVVGIIGAALFILFINFLIGYLTSNENHPLNFILQLFGARPMMLNMEDILNVSVFDLIKVIISIITAAGIYISLAAVTAIVTCRLIKALGNKPL